MKHTLMQLPYDKKALQPLISEETLTYHHQKHHQGYIYNLNNLIEGTQFEDMELEEIIKNSTGPIYNNAAQVFNHNFYFNSMTSSKTEPSGQLTDLIQRDFGSIAIFKKTFLEIGAKIFGSGWVWLSINSQGVLELEGYSNADSPLIKDNVALLCCDVWEHSYYIDYRNARAKYLEKWWDLINWDFVTQNLKKTNLKEAIM